MLGTRILRRTQPHNTPFRNAPNDVPLCTMLVFYNEALNTTFAGYHPDAYWNKADILKKNTEKKVDDDGPLLIPELPAENEY